MQLLYLIILHVYPHPVRNMTVGKLFGADVTAGKNFVFADVHIRVATPNLVYPPCCHKLTAARRNSPNSQEESAQKLLQGCCWLTLVGRQRNGIAGLTLYSISERYTGQTEVAAALVNAMTLRQGRCT